MLNRLKDVFGSFQRHEVRYVVIGGVASVIHGVPRATFDPDILIDADPDNVQNLLDALLDAGLGTASLTDAEEVLSNEITIFKDRVRIDVQTSTPGLDFISGGGTGLHWDELDEDISVKSLLLGIGDRTRYADRLKKAS